MLDSRLECFQIPVSDQHSRDLKRICPAVNLKMEIREAEIKTQLLADANGVAIIIRFAAKGIGKQCDRDADDLLQNVLGLVYLAMLFLVSIKAELCMGVCVTADRG